MNETELLRQLSSRGWNDPRRDYDDIYSWAHGSNDADARSLLLALDEYLRRESEREREDALWQERRDRNGNS